MASAPQHSPIPGPIGMPLLGNIYDLDAETPLNSLERLADTYGALVLACVCDMRSYTSFCVL